MSGTSNGSEALGGAAEEAARLAEALQGWWARPSSGQPPGPGHDPAGACRYCPLCRALAAAQTLRPEVVEQLLAAADAFAGAWREMARDRAPTADPPRRPPADAAERPEPQPGPAGPGGAGPRTVRIPVEDESGADQEPTTR